MSKTIIENFIKKLEGIWSDETHKSFVCKSIKN